MKIETFKVEKWMNEYETGAKYNIAETCVNTLSLDELFSIAQIDKVEFFNNISQKTLGYGYIQGAPEYKAGIASLYKTVNPQNIISTNGAAGANYLVFYSLINPGDEVISVLPTYQQLYSIPASLGADVKILKLKPENDFLPDIEELKSLVTSKTKLICINNPNNPSGALIPENMLLKIIEIAGSVGAYILSDEVYRGLNQDDEYAPSVADLYEKGISVSSMSKVFSLAGLRLGWIASNNKDVINECLSHREYNIISCGLLDEIFASLALANADDILIRNKKIIRENLCILDEWVSKQPYIYYKKPKAGTTALLYYDFNISSEKFCDEVYKQNGVFLTPGFCFELEHCVRIGYACDKKLLINGLDSLADYVNNLSFVLK